jgi:hypothetical protein
MLLEDLHHFGGVDVQVLPADRDHFSQAGPALRRIDHKHH